MSSNEKSPGVNTKVLSLYPKRYWKILVDVIADKLIGIIVPEGEKNTIIEEACSRYLIDVGTMMRYAKRKGAVRKLTSKMEEIRRNTE